MTGETGAAGVVVAALVGVALILSLLVMDVAQVVAARAQSATAADAAALAAAPVTFSAFGTGGDPVEEAERVAAANGARLIECRCPVDRSWRMRRVQVSVSGHVRLALLGDRQVTAVAAAEFRPIALVQR